MVKEKERVNVPANALTYNSRMLRFEFELNDDGSRAEGIIALEVDGVPTGDMEFVADAVESHWHISRKTSTEKFSYVDNVNSKAIRHIANKLSVAVIARKRPMHLQEVAA